MTPVVALYDVLAETVAEGGVPTHTTAERTVTALYRLVEFRLKR